MHFNMTESTAELGMEVNEKNQLLFDTLKSKLAKNVHGVTSQHLAVGQHCINMLLGTGNSIKKESMSHHTSKLKRGGLKKRHQMGGII